jgi:uncharacterized protein
VHKTAAGLSLSATDLSNSLACRQLTGLDMSVVLEGRKRPFRPDPLRDILRDRGLAHEKAYVDFLRAEGRNVLDLSALKDPETAAAATLDAMRAGQGAIVQAALLADNGRWYGRPDVLLRIEKPGTWPWSYEAVDTKLAQETKGGTILQLSFYSDLLRAAQGVEPEHFHVVTPLSGPQGETYRAGPRRGHREELPRTHRPLRRLRLVQGLRHQAPRRRPPLPRGGRLTQPEARAGDKRHRHPRKPRPLRRDPLQAKARLR